MILDNFVSCRPVVLACEIENCNGFLMVSWQFISCRPTITRGKTHFLVDFQRFYFDGMYRVLKDLSRENKLCPSRGFLRNVSESTKSVLLAEQKNGRVAFFSISCERPPINEILSCRTLVERITCTELLTNTIPNVFRR